MEDPLNFLKKKYNLHTSQEVASAAKRTEFREDKKVSQNAVEQIQNYLNRFKEILDRKNSAAREQGMEALKRVLHKHFVIDKNKVPEETFLLEQRIARNRGHGDVEITDEYRNEKSEQIINAQKRSLDKWIDYLASPDAEYPQWAKYWAFRSILEMGKLEKYQDAQGNENARFKNRTDKTVAPFPALNPRALATTIGSVKSRYEENQKPKAERGLLRNKSKKLMQNEFEGLISSENFSKIYTQFLIEMPEYSTEGLQEIRGEWVKYPQDSEPDDLVKSLDGYPLEWCTADPGTARTQLQGGDFYVFYSLNKEGKPIIPRAAIRMEAGSIAEVRGIAPDQNMDPYIAPVVEEKMKEFPDGKIYAKKSRDMEKLTAVESKVKLGGELGPEDLAFLYEINGPIQGFGFSRDPRIKELLAGRNPIEDIPIVFDCTMDQVATSVSMITENTKAYIGPLEAGLYDRLPANINHVYTKFPGGKIMNKEITVGSWPNNIQEFEEAMKSQNYKITRGVESLLKQSGFTFSKEPRETTLIMLSLEELGFSYQGLGIGDSVEYSKIKARALELGLGLCPIEEALQLRLQYNDQPGDDYLRIGMEEVLVTWMPGDNPYPAILSVDHMDEYDHDGSSDEEVRHFDEILLDAEPVSHKFSPANHKEKFVFVRPRK